MTNRCKYLRTATTDKPQKLNENWKEVEGTLHYANFFALMFPDRRPAATRFWPGGAATVIWSFAGN